MKRLLKISNNTTLVLCSISIAGLVFTNTFFLMLRDKIINIGDVESFMGKFSIPVAVVYFIFIFFHLSAILTLILQLNFFKRDNFLRAFLFFTGITSLLMLFGDFALASDISKEYIFGLPGEFNILFFSQALHFIFYILIIVLLVLTRKSVRKEGEEIVLKDDSIFINAQYIGILSGISGLILITIFSFLYLTVYPLPSWAVDAGIIVISLIAVIPYILIVLYWLIIKLREGISEWYDEKQYQDITRASLVTLIASIIVMAAIFVVQYFVSAFNIMSEIWFPFYIFLVLLLFSASTLYFNKSYRLISKEGNNRDTTKRNKNLGLVVLIISYLTLIFWLLGIFLSVEIGIGWESYTAVGFFGLLMIASGIIFLLSLIFNIIESRENKHISRGLVLTIVSIPPIAFCYLAILVKALTEGH
ncbi:MAG: hypothetical protein IMZ45_00210 [Actinobacteria bacterium]|nr:hypothetical protein [Actinomycetota bacterium]